MDEDETKCCPNCKREIPAVNFTIHSVHCARNIKICPVCKEPVPSSDLDDHHQKMHKLLPCKQCGESVCGTDLEDHIRDSCGNTIKSCRFCELELPRRELPTHEGYCGVRTEQCPDCKEYVMIKYQQLHLDSNHGFIRLDDDPAPTKKEPPRLNLCRPVAKSNLNKPNVSPSNGNGRIAPNIRNITKTEVNIQGSSSIGHGPSPSNISQQEATSSVVRASGVKKRTNDQPQINMDTSATKTVDKDLGAVSRGAVKKRPAPQPPRASSRRDLPYYSALQRQQREERERQEQNEYNLAHGLPPVLNPAQKVEKLRKLDALQNRDYEEEYRSRQRRPSPEQAHEQGYTLGSYQDMDEATRQEFKNLKPMSPSQFMKRFSSLQVSPPSSAKSGDRFPEIKSSLRELRRGLNEVTAPYNANTNTTTNNNNDRMRSPSPVVPYDEVQLPCEFCNMLVPADDLVQHQTGCRPDLARLVPELCEPAPRAPAPAPAPAAPCIPCEFCMRSLPVYLITEHQERCIRENMPV